MKPLPINIQKRMADFQITGLSLASIDQGRMSSTECFGLLEAGTDKMVKRNSIFSACSISKFVTSMLVMILTEQGMLDLDEDVNEKLTSWKVPDHEFMKRKKVTLRNLLCHQSGVIDPPDSFTERTSMTDSPETAELLAGMTPYCKAPIELKYEPWSEFRYSDAGYSIIQLVIEDAAGIPYTKLVHDHIFHPLNMSDSTFDLPASSSEIRNFSCGHSKSGDLVKGKYPVYPFPAASGLWTTPADLAFLVIELMNAIKGESSLKLSAEKAMELFESQGCKEWSGLGVFLDHNQKGIEISSLGWGAGFQCMLVAYPFLEKGLVIMTNTDTGVHQLEGIIGEIYREWVVNF
ncbi:serine hydrolase domain-containing protein [Metabacillus indicus]|uniref:serine hydrolase domain-containing protein n=1 Tax=Metabacillus indicus TaxID=246786 RepID=UPI0024913F8B|nr:serine hydrolase domain-containing protein [Metabacillus indicus]